jgi:hypothetical protein
MLEAAKSVDDYISDANTIAQAIGDYCGSEFHAYRRLASQGEEAEMADGTNDLLNRDRQKDGTFYGSHRAEAENHAAKAALGHFRISVPKLGQLTSLAVTVASRAG